MVKFEYTVSGMTCSSCERLIENRLSKLVGVQSVKADFKKNGVEVVSDGRTSNKQIKDSLSGIGYPVSEGKKRNNILLVLGAISIFAAIYLGIENLGLSDMGFAKIDQSTSYVLLFLLGLVTGLHCIAMC
ncbi:MAG: cation transporter, partial [Candidatus Micrarchaeota archaeon]